MLGSLYGDLPQAKDSDSTPASGDSKPATAWAAHLRAPPRRPTQLTAPPSVLRAGKYAPPPPSACHLQHLDGTPPQRWVRVETRLLITLTGRGRGAGRGRDLSSGPQPSAEASSSGSGAHSQPAAPAASLFSTGGTKPLVNEYDPAKPNDYEAIRAERERLRIEVAHRLPPQTYLATGTSCRTPTLCN